jgi:hypothetical protein
MPSPKQKKPVEDRAARPIKVALYLDQAIHRDIRIAAIQRDTTASALVNTILSDWLRDQFEQPKGRVR